MELEITTNCFGPYSLFPDWVIVADLLLLYCKLARFFLRTLASRPLRR